MALTEKANHIILRLICCRGLVPNVLDSPEWEELMTLLSSKYVMTAASKFTEEYIPAEASFVREEQLKELRKCENLTISFDGGDTRRDSIYFVHATTPDRRTYFLEGHIGSTEHHTTEWVKDKVLTVCCLMF